MSNIADIRREYDLKKLDAEQLMTDPTSQFNAWLEEAIHAKLQDPTAMIVATVSPEGWPSQRIVLLKDVTQQGFIFYTNLGSQKAQDIKENDKVSLHFPWHALERQVRIQGHAKKLDVATVTKYFLSRPKESQLAAWASKQSHPVATRQLLMNKFNEIKQKFKAGDVPLPDFWGGYCVEPEYFEFWQGGEHRLHDRFVYRKNPQAHWDISRLMP